MLSIKLVPKEQIEDIWPDIEEWVRGAIGVDQSYAPEDVKRLCKTNASLLLIYTTELKGFLIFQIFNAPQCKVCYAPYLGGKDLADWVIPAFDEFKKYLKSEGVKQYSWIGRKVWGRFLKVDSEQSFYLVTI